MRTTIGRGLAALALAAALAACGEDGNAKGGDPGGENTQNTAPRTMAITVEGIMANPAVYYKQPMAIPGYINEIIGPNALVIGDKPGGEPGILVINNAQSQVSFANSAVGQQIFVQGDLRPFEEAAPSGEAMAAELGGRFAGQPVLLATTVANSDGGGSGSEVTASPLAPTPATP